MPFSPFTQEYFELKVRGADGQIHSVRTRLFDPAVSARRDCEIMIEPLSRRGYWRQMKVGRLSLVVLRAREVLQTAEEMAREGDIATNSLGMPSSALPSTFGAH